MQGERAGEPAGPDVWETCRELIPAGSVFAFLAGHREALFPAGMFADMYPSPNGRPSMPPQVLAVVVVLQALEGLPDFEAVQVLRCDLRWKAACGLGLLGSDGSDGRWRIARRTAPDRVVSVVDPETRHIHKNRTSHQDGFKAHVSFEPGSGLFTAVALTGGSGAGNHEAAVAAGLLAGEDEELTVLGDTAYGTGELRERLQQDGHTAVIKPPALRPAVPGGFTIDDFIIDDQAGTVTCPAGHTVAPGRPHVDGTRLAQFKARCRGCPLRGRCTTAKAGRVLSIHPQHALLATARRAAADPAWQAGYRRWRPSAERAIAWLVAGGNRRVPYRGVTKNNAWLHHRAAALNLRRLVNLGLTRASDGNWALA
ncbi:MAG TPA: transposase [Streptosporangiaceae bacterium]|nr:transposase [Streptosporangiaceae bacterium]